MDRMPTFSEKLKQMMARRRMTQNELAEMLQTQQSRISNWANDKGIPDIYQGHRLARVFNVPMEYLADDSLDEPAGVCVSVEERALIELAREVGVRAIFRPGKEEEVEAEDYEEHAHELYNRLADKIAEMAMAELRRRDGIELPAAGQTKLAKGKTKRSQKGAG